MFINPLYFYNQAYLFVVNLITVDPANVILFKIIWFGLGFIFFALFIILSIKKLNLLKTEKAQMDEAVKNIQNSAMPSERNTVWEKIIQYLESTNPSDWKLAIL